MGIEEGDIKKLVDKYVELRNREKSLADALKEAKRDREELREILTSHMDARGIGTLTGEMGYPVTLVTTTRIVVNDFERFRRWCDENGKREEFIRESLRVGTPARPGVKQFIEQSGELPPGIETGGSLHLRVGKPRRRTLMERLEGVGRR